ncbi:hypothetical protein J2Y42_003051 [Leifsonia sp. 1010]|nr:hypothetical protein [Leifsonia sp. 1010]
MSMSLIPVDAVPVEELSEEDGRRMVSMQVSDVLGISLEEFRRQVAEGRFDDSRDDAVLRLMMLLPFAE